MSFLDAAGASADPRNLPAGSAIQATFVFTAPTTCLVGWGI
jgi:hypothetical protein